MSTRCTASSYRGGRRRTPYGPGGYNRCIKPAKPDHGEHRDEWGNIFTYDATGRQKVLHREAQMPIGWVYEDAQP